MPLKRSARRSPIWSDWQMSALRLRLGRMPEALVALARRAESVGWAFDIAQDAIRKLAHEHLGARGAFSD
jgi:hypothetical protein